MPFKDEAKNKAAKRSYYENNKDLVRQRTRERREKNLRFVFEYLLSHPCVDCGESDPVVLEFDHLRDKHANVSRIVYGSTIDKILCEISKCDVVCCNCHRRRTTDRDFVFKNSLSMCPTG